jgi:arylsulfatase A-like enzyme
MISLALVIVLTSLSLAMHACQESDGTGREHQPNIVFIMADDLGYHDLGCYGQEKILTPNIDRLALEGMRFTDFYSGAAVCAPSRAVLQTGLHTGHTTVRGNDCREGGLRQPPGSEERPGPMRIGIPSSDTTLADILGRAGYHTGLFGKWHLSGYLYENLPVKRGYDEYMGSCLADPKSTRPGYMFHNDSVVKIPEEFSAESGDGLWTLLAIDFIKRYRDEPFFVMLCLSTPHKPFNIAVQGIYADSAWNEMSRNYAALVSRMDGQVGMVMNTLKELGLEENTILIFCSDNGGEYREVPEDWAEWTRTFESNKPLKGGKADFYEGGIRIPFILRWPGITDPAEVCSQPLYFADILPTFADIAGLPVPERSDGISMRKILTGETEKLGDRFMYWEFEHWGFHQAVRWKNWVMLRWTGKQQRIYGQETDDNLRISTRYPFYELYNLSDDISQDSNLIELHPEVAAVMLDYLRTARTDSPYFPLTERERNSLDCIDMTLFR